MLHCKWHIEPILFFVTVVTCHCATVWVTSVHRNRLQGHDKCERGQPTWKWNSSTKWNCRMQTGTECNRATVSGIFHMSQPPPVCHQNPQYFQLVLPKVNNENVIYFTSRARYEWNRLELNSTLKLVSFTYRNGIDECVVIRICSGAHHFFRPPSCSNSCTTLESKIEMKQRIVKTKEKSSWLDLVFHINEIGQKRVGQILGLTMKQCQRAGLSSRLVLSSWPGLGSPTMQMHVG